MPALQALHCSWEGLATALHVGVAEKPGSLKM
jgi:hypothetical protein